METVRTMLNLFSERLRSPDAVERKIFVELTDEDIVSCHVSLNKEVMKYYGQPLGCSYFSQVPTKGYKSGMFISENPFRVSKEITVGLGISNTTTAGAYTSYSGEVVSPYDWCPLAIPYKVVQKYMLTCLNCFYLGGDIFSKPYDAVLFLLKDELGYPNYGSALSEWKLMALKSLPVVHDDKLSYSPHLEYGCRGLKLPDKIWKNLVDFTFGNGRKLYTILADNDYSPMLQVTDTKGQVTIRKETKNNMELYSIVSRLSDFFVKELDGDIESISWLRPTVNTFGEITIEIDVNPDTRERRVWIL